MKKLTHLALSAVVLLLFAACGEKHFISDEAERRAVTADFEARRDTIGKAALFDVFSEEMGAEEREALTFLYAYMPLADIADHPGSFFLEHVSLALKAREEMPWGSSIPEREFRHFVLPLRVNNENLDSCRKVFYEELKPRIAHLSLREAVLEVNHWCHEKVNYRPSDARTSSPLASVRTAYGRCGEESTFTVSALRAVGIPARQVYTPRWAHTDDNHAWVEAWVDGAWHFLGACEPEPVLDLGWFNAPASRGMLMHTKVFGRYNGPEEVMLRTPRYTEINVIENYAPAARAVVTVLDTDGQPAADAKVEFKVYNYAEYFTVATKYADADGRAALTAGKGDMLVWASKEGRFGFAQLSFGQTDSLTLVLERRPGEEPVVDFDITPPAERANMPEVTAEQRAENDRRFAEEDSIRNAYVATFPTEAEARAFAEAHGCDPAVVAPLIVAARGNYATIMAFISALPEAERADGIALLHDISAKDLRDVALETLLDHMRYVRGTGLDPWVRNPRVSNEMIQPYKAFFSEAVPAELAEAWRAEPMQLVAWVADSIRVDAACNLGAAPITPVGVWRTRMADAHSRNIFFVALARSMGIPARIDGVTGKVQLVQAGGKTVDVRFEAETQALTPRGVLRASYAPTKTLNDPKYYTHFTLSKLTPEGISRLLGYDESHASWRTLLKNGLPLDTGNYVLTTGTRLAKGGVLARSAFFHVKAGKTTDLALVMRESREEVQVIGNFNSESTFRLAATGQPVSVLTTTGRGYYVVAVLGVGQEPTNHALRDIAALGGEFEKWGRKMILLFPSEDDLKKFDAKEFPGLPSTVVCGVDADGAIQNQIRENMELGKNVVLPLFIIGDTFNRVVFCSQGYTIGLGEQMMKVIRGL